MNMINAKVVISDGSCAICVRYILQLVVGRALQSMGLHAEAAAQIRFGMQSLGYGGSDGGDSRDSERDHETLARVRMLLDALY
jgi:hypothetical protein